MRLKIQKAIEALENMPSGNAGVETFMEYQRSILTPALHGLRESRNLLLGKKEIESALKLTKSFISALEGHLEICGALERFFGAEIGGIEEHQQYLQDVKGLDKKFTDMHDAEQVEELIASSPQE